LATELLRLIFFCHVCRVKKISGTLLERFCSSNILFWVQAENHYRESAMSSPWEPGISQAMQRHGGSNRSIPKTKPSSNARSNELPTPETQGQAAIVPDLPVKLEKSEAKR
jgi:hypothetical protein